MKKNTKKNINIDKKWIIFITILASIICIKFITIFLIDSSPSFALFYTKYIINIKNGTVYFIFPYIPFIKTISQNFQLEALILFTIGFTALVFSNSKDILKKLNKKQKNTAKKVSNVSIIITLLSVFLLSYDITEYLQIESIPNMEKTIYKEYKDKEYKIEDVDNLMNYLDSKIEEHVNNKYDDMNEKDLVKQSKKDLENIKEEIPYLTGLYPSKVFSYDAELKELYGSNLTGLTSYYLVFYNDNAPTTSTLNTITHEFCHSKSIFKENEAVYCSYVAGINSDNKLSNYSAYLEAYFRIAFAYSTIDLEKSIEYEDKYLSKCLTEDKDEFCNVYGKTTKKFINGSKYLWLKTYSLKNYANYKDELIDALSTIVDSGYRLKLENANKYIELGEISDLIDSNSMDRIVIQEKLNKDKFNKIKSAFTNERLFLSVMQMEDNDSNFSNGDPLEFFLDPVENEESNGSMYTYSRIIRLILIYHDIHGYK